jgi:hypothetical protein
MKKFKLTLVPALSLCAVGFLFSSASSQAVTSKVFSGTAANSIANGFDYFDDGETVSGGIVDTVTLTTQPSTENFGSPTPGVLTFRFLAPTGMQFRLDGAKYSDQARLSMDLDLFGFSSAPLSTGGTVSLLNPTGTLNAANNASTSITGNPFNNKVMFSSLAANLTGVGTFTGVEFTFYVSGLSNIPVTWSGPTTSSNNLVLPFFTARSDTSVNNGPILTLVPEPSALSLLAVGLGGLAMMRRRKS